MSQLVAFFYGANLAAPYDAFEVDTVAVVPLHKLQALLVEVTEPRVPNLGVGNCVHCQLRFFISIVISAQVKHKRVQIAVLSLK